MPKCCPYCARFSSISADAPIITALNRVAALNRIAVFLATTSRYFASVVSGLLQFNSCKTSPSAMAVVVFDRISMTRILPVRTIISKALEYR